MENFVNDLDIKGHKLRIQWGKSKEGSSASMGTTLESRKPPVVSLDDLDKLALPPPPGQGPILYPSMDPKMLGTATETYRS